MPGRSAGRAVARHPSPVIKGTNPGDIPFEQATKLELVVNLKAAKAPGLMLPQSVLAGADQVIG